MLIAALSCFLVIFVPQFASAADAATAAKPNIVVVLCDDLGYGDLGCYGHPHIKTPHLDQMAQEGARFTDFYSAAPVCSPSRVGLMTGRSPNRAGVYDWIPPGSDVHLRQSEITLAQLLQQAGYATCMSGKWHCNGKFNSAQQPQLGQAGFDHWFATQNNAAPSHQNPVNFVRNGQQLGPLQGFSCQLVVDEALDWLTKHHQNALKQPFFMYLAFHEPHEPIASPQELVESYRDVANNTDQAQYYANVTNLDAAVGQLFAGLKATGSDENTLVIFTSDNGPETLKRYKTANRSYGTAKPLRGMKLWTTDGGFRVPGIMRWPAKIEPGLVVNQVVSTLDFLPTFCALGDVPLPPGRVLDGTDFLPALSNKQIVREKPLVWVYYRALNQRRVAMRDGEWKVLARLNTRKHKSVNDKNQAVILSAELSDFRIFRIAEDIDESEELSATHPDKLMELRERLESHYRELVDGSHVWGSGK